MESVAVVGLLSGWSEATEGRGKPGEIMSKGKMEI